MIEVTVTKKLPMPDKITMTWDEKIDIPKQQVTLEGYTYFRVSYSCKKAPFFGHQTTMDFEKVNVCEIS